MYVHTDMRKLYTPFLRLFLVSYVKREMNEYVNSVKEYICAFPQDKWHTASPNTTLWGPFY